MDKESIATRLERLERQCRRLRRAGIVFAILVGTPVLLVLVAASLSDGTREATSLLIRDQQGKVRMDLGTWKDGSPRLVFADRGGTIRLEVGVRGDDSPKLALYDAPEKLAYRPVLIRMARS
jgi:hypothetical protein